MQHSSVTGKKFSARAKNTIWAGSKWMCLRLSPCLRMIGRPYNWVNECSGAWHCVWSVHNFEHVTVLVCLSVKGRRGGGGVVESDTRGLRFLKTTSFTSKKNLRRRFLLSKHAFPRLFQWCQLTSRIWLRLIGNKSFRTYSAFLVPSEKEAQKELSPNKPVTVKKCQDLPILTDEETYLPKLRVL